MIYYNFQMTQSNKYITPFIQITADTPYTFTIGMIKDNINYDELIKSMHTNEKFVEYIKSTNYKFIPNPGYYDDNVKQFFDIYGGSYTVNINSIDYTINIYFYKLKHIELLTQEFIKKFKIIFDYDYYKKNNILDPDWHLYRLSLFTKDIEAKSSFYNLGYKIVDICKTKLFNHQISNITRMLDIYYHKHKIQITDDLISKFDNGLCYNIVKNTFISEDEIPTITINNCMILDEPGTGKTLQALLFLIETRVKSIILVPNNDIKKVWLSEFEKHIMIHISEFPIHIYTFSEISNELNIIPNILNDFDIIIIDEIHIMYTKYQVLFENIINSNIKSRWGITGTPFVNDMSLFNIIKYLCGIQFTNERIVNSPSLQNNFINLFLRNLKINMKNDYEWPDIIINNVYVNLDIIQENIYKIEKDTNSNPLVLRKLISELQLVFNNASTPSQLKTLCIEHYNMQYINEVKQLQKLQEQLDNIEKNQHIFTQDEYIKRHIHYTQLISSQKYTVIKYKNALDYFVNSINTITNIIQNENSDENCPICWDNYDIPIIYFKTCGHFFCDKCIRPIKSHQDNFKCPMCRQNINSDDTILVKSITEINNSPKMHKIIELISMSAKKFIIFTQFNILDKIKLYLTNNNIISSTFNEYTIDTQVLLLSSAQNAEGIDLSTFDNIIIFEPFEDHIYSNEIEKQLVGRIHRIGRKDIVNVYRFITSGTIEEDIYAKINI